MKSSDSQSEQAAELIAKAGKREVLASEQHLSLQDVLELAGEVGIDPALVRQELLAAEAQVESKPVTAEPGLGKVQSAKVTIHRETNYIVVSGEPPGWKPAFVARLIVWISALGFVGYYLVHQGATTVSVCTLVPFAVWIAWTVARMWGRIRERTFVVVSRDAFSVRTVNPWGRREMSGREGGLRIDEPRVARNPDGGIELFPLYFLRVASNDHQLDLMLGHEAGALRAVHEAVKAWRSYSGQQSSIRANDGQQVSPSDGKPGSDPAR